MQKGAITALDDASIPGRTKAKYERRLRKLVDMLRRSGFTCAMPGGTYFLYTTNLNFLSNNQEDQGGMMTEIVVN